MPIIELEKRIPVAKGISKIKITRYDLPEHIVYEGEYLSYDSYHQAYLNSRKFITAKDYLKMILADHSSEKNAEEDGVKLNNI